MVRRPGSWSAATTTGCTASTPRAARRSGPTRRTTTSTARPRWTRARRVFGGCDALIHVVSLADGAKIAEIDSGSYIAASAAFVDGQVYVGNYENVFLRADLSEGKILWQYTQSEAPFFSSPAVGEQFVVLGGRDEYVHCVRRDNGQRVWAFKTLGEVNSSPAICGDKINRRQRRRPALPAPPGGRQATLVLRDRPAGDLVAGRGGRPGRCRQRRRLRLCVRSQAG